MIVGLSRALAADFGVRAGRVAMLVMQNPGSDCRSRHDPVRGVRFHRDLAERLPKVPEITSVGWAATAPLGRGTLRQYGIQAGTLALDRVDFNVNIVTPGYFRTMGIPIIEGRPFDQRDGPRSEVVAIIDERLARRYFGTTAVGRHLLDHRGDRISIVGVVRSGRYRTLQDSPQPTVHLPYAQEHLPCGFLFVRTASEPSAMIPAITRALTDIDGGVTITRAQPLEQHLSEALAIDRLTTTLVGLCGILALVMGTAGVYGVMSDAVLRRTREIGLRVALGAGRAQVVTLVLAEALYLTIGGIFTGIGCALVLERLAATVVHGLPRVAGPALLTIPTLLAVVVALAAVLPLRRALAVSPTIALRAE
jgi:hypothetical protein